MCSTIRQCSALWAALALLVSPMAGGWAAPAAAVVPKPLSAHVQRGLAYLINQQDQSGGWGQGGGWRAGASHGRVEGPNVADPPDVASTCMAVLALLRSGSCPLEGPYADHIRRGIEFICKHVDQSDRDSLYVTDVRDTQIQVKIGPYVDTFLTTLVLAEVKGKMVDEPAERRLSACLDKAIAKIEKHQQADGSFAANNGWAPIFSQGLASKSLNRAKQKGAVVNDEVLARAERNATDSLSTSAVGGRGPSVGMFGGAPSLAAPAAGSRAADAGVPLYRLSNNMVSIQESLNTGVSQKAQARAVLDSASASTEEKEQARAVLGRVARTEKVRQAAVGDVIRRLDDRQFVQGFGSNGGEEFLSYLNISETLVTQGGQEWMKWDRSITENLNRVQNGDGSWSGNHCITGRTVCTAAALLVLMADRTPIPAAAASGK